MKSSKFRLFDEQIINFFLQTRGFEKNHLTTKFFSNDFGISLGNFISKKKNCLVENQENSTWYSIICSFFLHSNSTYQNPFFFFHFNVAMKINCRLHVKICANRSFYVTTIILVSDIGIPSIRRLHAICVNLFIQNCSSTHNFHAFVLLLFLMMIPFIRAKMQIFYQIIPNNIVPGVVLFLHILRLYGITHHMRCMHTVSATRIVHFIWFFWTLFFLRTQNIHNYFVNILLLNMIYRSRSKRAIAYWPRWIVYTFSGYCLHE